MNFPVFSFRYNDYNDWRQKFNKAELEIDRLRRVFCPFPDDFALVPRNLSIYFPLKSSEKCYPIVARKFARAKSFFS